MRRVTRAGGTTATVMWDNTGRNELMNTFWSAATALDPGVKREDLRPGTFGSAEALSELWRAAGLQSVETKELSLKCSFSSFDDYWSPRAAEGPTASYIRSLPPARQEILQEIAKRDFWQPAGRTLHVERKGMGGSRDCALSFNARRGNRPSGFLHSNRDKQIPKKGPRGADPWKSASSITTTTNRRRSCVVQQRVSSRFR